MQATTEKLTAVSARALATDKLSVFRTRQRLALFLLNCF